MPTGKSTFADGLADDRLIEPAWSRCIAHLDDMITVDDDALREAMRTLLQQAGIRAEGAGAAALAGYISYDRRPVGDHVTLILSGGNLDDRTAGGEHGSQQSNHSRT